MTPITVLVQTRLQPGVIDDGISALKSLAKTVRREEPDCLAIEIAQDVDDPTRLTMIEKWTSREAYEGPHMETPHMKAFVEAASRFFAGPPDISFWNGTVIG